jgi:hypothetical protein
MRIDGKEVARKKMERTILAWDESQDIGSDTLTGVNDDYKVPSASMARSRKSRHQPAEAQRRRHREAEGGDRIAG